MSEKNGDLSIFCQCGHRLTAHTGKENPKGYGEEGPLKLYPRTGRACEAKHCVSCNGYSSRTWKDGLDVHEEKLAKAASR